jgi:hypothetical protein
MRRRVVLPVVALLIAGVALFILIRSGRGAYEATKAGYSSVTDSNDPARRNNAAAVGHFGNVRRQLATAVPAGSTIVIDPKAGSLWLQRVAEFAVMSGIHVTVDPAKAGYAVAVTAGKKGAAPHLLIERLP